MPRADRDDQAFTGLEVAIVFIAFIVVASVFAYAVLGAGMSSSQKSQEVMYSALEEAGSVFRPGYAVIAKLDAGQGYLSFIELDLETATDLAAIDMGSITCAIATKETLITLPPGDSRVSMSWRHRNNADNLLEAGEIVTIHLDTENFGIGRGDTFTLEITAADGATASLTRTIPASVEKNVYLELF